MQRTKYKGVVDAPVSCAGLLNICKKISKLVVGAGPIFLILFNGYLQLITDPRQLPIRRRKHSPAEGVLGSISAFRGFRQQAPKEWLREVRATIVGEGRGKEEKGGGAVGRGRCGHGVRPRSWRVRSVARRAASQKRGGGSNQWRPQRWVL